MYKLKTLFSRLLVSLLLLVVCPLFLTTAAYATTNFKPQQQLVATVVATDSNSEHIIFGEEKNIGEGSITSWIKLDKNYKPVSVGISLNESAVETAAKSDEEAPGKDGIKLQLKDGIGHQTYEYELALPQITSAEVPFTHVGVNWNPFGHGPQDIFTTGHWDIHFYTIEPEQRHKIKQDSEEDVEISNKLPPQGFLNADYKLALGTAEPRMGSHTADFTSPELEPGKFGNIFIFGIHNGQVVHWEPMISNDFLIANSESTGLIKLPQYYFKSGYYPTKYTVKHDKEKHEYKISLDDMQYRVAYEKL